MERWLDLTVCSSEKLSESLFQGRHGDTFWCGNVATFIHETKKERIITHSERCRCSPLESKDQHVIVQFGAYVYAFVFKSVSSSRRNKPRCFDSLTFAVASTRGKTSLRPFSETLRNGAMLFPWIFPFNPPLLRGVTSCYDINSCLTSKGLRERISKGLYELTKS